MMSEINAGTERIPAPRTGRRQVVAGDRLRLWVLRSFNVSELVAAGSEGPTLRTIRRWIE